MRVAFAYYNRHVISNQKFAIRLAPLMDEATGWNCTAIHRDKIGDYRGDVAVFIKTPPEHLVLQCLENGVRPILHVSDCRQVFQHQVAYLPLFKAIVFNNVVMSTQFALKYGLDGRTKCLTIYEYGEPGLLGPSPKFFAAYIGHRESAVSWLADVPGVIWEGNTAVRTVPLHVSIREPGSLNYMYKPSTKLATACAQGSLIVLTHDWCHEDIMYPDYPLYAEATPSSVLAKIELARSYYGTPSWDKTRRYLSYATQQTQLSTFLGRYQQMIEDVVSRPV